MLSETLKSVKTAVAEEAAVDVMAEVADTEVTVEEVVMAADTEEIVKAEEILVHVMVDVKVADTKVTVTMPVEVEIAEILVHHVLQVAIEERAAILSLKRVAHVKELLNHALLVLHEAMHLEHQEVTLQELLVAKALQAVLLNLHLETLTKKTNLLRWCEKSHHLASFI